MKGEVGGRGKKSAPVMIIGEAPGGLEVIKGQPFVGASGHMLWNELKQVGIYPSDCYVTNAVKINPGKFPDGKQGAELLKTWASKLDKELRAASPKVILLVGGQALKRLTSFTSIKDWRGSCLTAEDLPNTLVWHATKTRTVDHPCVLPDSQPVIIPTLHPAGLMRSKGREDVVLFKRDLRKASNVLRGLWKPHEMNTFFNMTAADIYSCLVEDWGQTKYRKLFFDTEFNPETKEMFWVGLTANGRNVYGFPWAPQYYSLMKKLMEDERVEKAAHNIRADKTVVEHAGIEMRGELFCTMIGMYTLHPDQMVGLSPTTRYYLENAKNHKWMKKDDPVYNAYDVSYGWGCWMGELEEAKQRPVDPLPEMRSRFAIIDPCYGMEVRGMPVDTVRQGELIDEQDGIISSLMKEVEDVVAPYWDERVREVLGEQHKHQRYYEALREAYYGRCKKHPKFYPSKKAPKCEVCQLTKERFGEEFTKAYKEAQKELTKIKGKVKRWEKGFNYKSSEHLKWFLYDCLKLPLQRKLGKVTSNADAIERLSKLKSVQKKKKAFDAVMKMKKMQQATKAKSTFLEVPVGVDGAVHPPYKVHGTVTGRLAGGQDTRGEEDKVDGSQVINPLNIPKRWRSIYVPRPGKCLVAADWKNQEGRLMAYFSQDRGYLEAFKQEDAGGHDVHSLTAAIVYGCEPGQARELEVKFNGGMYSMRHCAKVANHAWSYSPTPVNTLMKNFQMELEEAVRIDKVLTEARPGIAGYKQRLVEEVLGRWQVGGNGKAQCVVPGSRFYSNPFGWQVYFWGMGEVRTDPVTKEKVALGSQAGEVVAQGPQSTGASMWAWCCAELERRGYVLYTGTYDSFVLEVEDNDEAREDAARVFKDVMERPWDELDGMVFPIDIEVGYNLGPYKEGDNPMGLKEV